MLLKLNSEKLRLTCLAQSSIILFTTLAAPQVVHSDLKALNILLTRGWEVAKIGDVGVARFMHAKDGSGEVAMGTFAYAAPETLLGIDSGVKVGCSLQLIVLFWLSAFGGFELILNRAQ
jgi:serine/threonine protein kinase